MNKNSLYSATLEPRDTIFALSSGQVPAAIAVIRISGPRAGAALEQLTGKRLAERRATLVMVRDPTSREPIDQALALWFPGPASETGEDTAELQLHGGRAVVAAALTALGCLEGLRPAEAGEFTRRAFENGRIDLTAVEGLADLIGAETEAQRRQALRQLRGLLGTRARAWREKIIGALALVEAGLDFSDESDVPADAVGPALRLAAELRDEIAGVLGDARRGERLRTGATVAIAGPPNAGKSSLFNALAGRDAAIVSPYPGTTRDVLELHLDLGGYPVTVLDTAGVRVSDDPVEQEGVRRARRRAEEADLVLWLEDVSAAKAAREADPVAEGPALWRVRTKIDLIDSASERCFSPGADGGMRTFGLSALTGAGVPALLAALEQHVADEFGTGESTFITRARHRDALEAARAALGRAVEGGARDEFMAEELRLAARALGRLLGRIDVEDVLAVIFRDFCIGK
jgi:tRNA modification GTPase